MSLIRIYTPEPCQGVDVFPNFTHRYGGKTIQPLFSAGLPKNFFEYGVEYVPLKNAQIIILPNNFKKLDKNSREYIGYWVKQSKDFGIPCLAFSHADFGHDLDFGGGIYVSRLSVYRSTMRVGDYVMPTLVSDPCAEFDFDAIKYNSIPVVGFCGMAKHRGFLRNLKQQVKSCFINCGALLNPNRKAQQIGVYFRKRAMRACEKSPRVKTSFIERSSFSGSLATIELDSKVARHDFLENINQSLVVLSPKGDGNYSNRFIEALAAGRIPAFIDTDIILPFEDEIDYSAITIRIAMRDIDQTGDRIADWCEGKTEDDFREISNNAKKVFEQFLKQDVAYKRLIQKLIAN